MGSSDLQQLVRRTDDNMDLWLASKVCAGVGDGLAGLSFKPVESGIIYRDTVLE